MRSAEIEKLVAAVEAVHGPLTLHGSDAFEEHGTCFRIPGAPATISAHTQDGRLPSGRYDIQIESVPPGDYIHTSVVSLEELLTLIDRVRGPRHHWPGLVVEHVYRFRSLLEQGRTRDEALALLRREGVSPIGCLQAIREVERVGLEEAKRLIAKSPSWADVVEATDNAFIAELESMAPVDVSAFDDAVRDRSLRQLEPSLRLSDGDSYLESEMRRLVEIPLKQFCIEDLRMVIGQGIGLHHLVPIAVAHLEAHPLAQGDYYSGDLLKQVMDVDERFWTDRPELRRRLTIALERALQRLKKARTPVELEGELRASLSRHRARLLGDH
jgi:ribosomal protein L7/L12